MGHHVTLIKIVFSSYQKPRGHPLTKEQLWNINHVHCNSHAPVGKCKLTFTRGNSKHLLQIQVVRCNIKPLIRAETCQKLKFPQVLINDKDVMTEDKMLANNAP